MFVSCLLLDKSLLRVISHWRWSRRCEIWL